MAAESNVGKGEEYVSPWKGPISAFDIYHTSLVDNTGIPLKSNRAEPELTEGIDFGLGPNPFKTSPSRYHDGHPVDTPVSELERSRLSHNWFAAISVVKNFRDAYLAATGKGGSSEPLTALQLLDVAVGVENIPWYAVFRKENPLPPIGAIPEPYFMASHAAAGVRAAVGLYLEGAVRNSQAMVEPIDTDKALELAEKSGNMVGRETVCPASPQQMRRFLEYMKNGYGEHHEDAVLDIFDKNKVINLVKFGWAFLPINSDVQSVVDYDSTMFESLSKDNINPFAVLQGVPYYFGKVRGTLQGLDYGMIAINNALERGRPSPHDLAEATRELNLKMPELIERVQAQIGGVNREQPNLTRAQRRAQKFGR